MINDDFSHRIAKADDDVRAFMTARGTVFGSYADAVRMFRDKINALRAAGADWPEINSFLKSWSGCDVAPGTIKQYMTDLNVGRMKPELRSTVGLPGVAGLRLISSTNEQAVEPAAAVPQENASRGEQRDKDIKDVASEHQIADCNGSFDAQRARAATATVNPTAVDKTSTRTAPPRTGQNSQLPATGGHDPAMKVKNDPE